jgi:hypothetical protein
VDLPWGDDGVGRRFLRPGLIGQIVASVAPGIIVLVRVVLGVLLLAHGLVHLLFLAPDLPAFSVKQSWLVPESVRTQAAYALLAATIGAFALLALAVWGIPGLSAAWPVIAVVAAALSSVLLVVFWNWQLGLGIVINAVIVGAAMARLGGVTFSSS